MEDGEYRSQERQGGEGEPVRANCGLPLFRVIKGL
jgi:hypothetical protein